MTSPESPGIDAVECASFPDLALPALASLRCEPNVTVALSGGRAWVRWAVGAAAVARAVLPIPGAELYVRRGPNWHRFGARLPSFGLPAEAADPLPLYRALTPVPVAPLPPEGLPPRTVALRLVR